MLSLRVVPTVVDVYSASVSLPAELAGLRLVMSAGGSGKTCLSSSASVTFCWLFRTGYWWMATIGIKGMIIRWNSFGNLSTPSVYDKALTTVYDSPDWMHAAFGSCVMQRGGAGCISLLQPLME